MSKVFCNNCYTETRSGRSCQWCGAKLERRKRGKSTTKKVKKKTRHI